MIGGAQGSMIGPVHRGAIEADGKARLVAGLFSRSPEKNRATASEAGVPADRVYDTLQAFLEGETARPSSQRLDWVSVVTPNVGHFEQIRRLVQAGFNVIADKPLTATRSEAEELYRIVAESGRFFALTHTYVGYDAVREARRMVAAGELGRLHKVVVEYFQGWMLDYLASGRAAEMPWRTRRAVSGDSCTTADIGTHAAHLIRYVTGLEIERLLASNRTYIPANELEDDVSVIIDYENDVRGVLLASQCSTGETNSLVLRVYGDAGALTWRHNHPGQLVFTGVNNDRRAIDVPQHSQGAAGTKEMQEPGGADAFASLYGRSFGAIRAMRAGTDPGDVDVPGIDDGLFGMRFVDCVLESDRRGSTWVTWPGRS